MPDLRQALKDFVATSNSGKYADEETLMSKFPELKGYDIQTLKDFVATSNSGKYPDENELFSKFPEFNTGIVPSKKKIGSELTSQEADVESTSKPTQQNTTELPSEDGSSVTQLPKKSKADTRISKSLGQINTDLMNDTEGNVVQKLSKDQNLKDLGFSFEESTWYGDYVTVTAPDGKTKKEFSLDNFLDSKSTKQSIELQNFIKQNSTKERRADLEQIAQIEDSNTETYKTNKKKFGQEFEQGAKSGFSKKNSKYLNDRLKTIDAKLINQNEEYVVPQMNYQFGDLGFKFEDSGMTGDWMTVTAPDGKTKIEISIDPFMDSKAISESAKLQQFIKTYTPDKGLYVVEKSANEGYQKIENQKQVDASIKKISDEANSLNNDLKAFISRKNALETTFEKGSEGYNKLQADLIAERDVLVQKQNSLKTKEILLRKSVGKYTEMRGQQGTYLAGTYNAFLDSSAGMTAGTADYMIDAMAEIMPNEMQMSPKDLKNESVGIAKKLGIKGPSENQTFAQWKVTLTEDQQDDVEDELDDITKKSVKKNIIPAIRKGNRELVGSTTATPEWEQLKSEKFWGGAYFGLVKTAPALLGGTGPAGWAQRTAQMYSMVSDGIRQEMDKNPEFARVSENEKLAVVLPIGITGAALEEFGLRNIKGSTGLINKMAMKALRKSTSRTTAKSFREIVENEVESSLAKGLLTITSAGLAEAESGAGQEITETGIKAIYNEIKDKKMFETPETAGQWVNNVVKAGAQEAVGGIVLGMPTAVSAAYSKKGFLNMSDQNFRVFEAAANDENIQKAFITNLKTQITQGALTTADAKEQLNNYRKSVGLFKSLPNGLNTQQKKEAMNLLKEKRDLQNEVDGKDPSLVKKQKERIDVIDASLVGISEAAATEKATAETNRKEFDALPDSEKIKLKDEAGRKLLDMVGDRNDDVFLDDETLTEFAFKDFVKQKEVNSRIAEIETTLSPDAEKPVEGRAKRKLEKELGKLKNTQDAIQEQSTTTIPVQSETTASETMETGVSESGPEVVTEEEVVEPRIKDSQIPLKRETFEFESAEGDILDVQVTTTKDGTREFVAKNKDGNVASSQKVGKDNTLTTEEYVTKGYGDIQGEPKVEQGNDIMAPAMKDKLTAEQKAELGIEETAPAETTTETAPVEALKDIESTTNALNEIGGENDLKNELSKKIDDKIVLLRDENDEISDDNLAEFRALIKAKNALNRGVATGPEAASMSGLNSEISKAYQKAKADGSNPELVKAVEELLAPKAEVAPEAEVAPVERTPIEIQESRVKSAESLLKEAKTKAAKKKAMTDLVTEQGRLAEMKAFEKTQGLSEAEIPGYDRMISEVEGIVEKSKKRRVSEAKMLDNVMSYVTGSKVYENATDVQREALVRKIRKDFGLREKSAPSAAKLFGKIKDVTKITITEKQGLIKQIKDTAKGAREAVKAFKLASQQLSKDIKELKESGKITSDQAANVIRAFSNVNVFSEKSVDRFTTYMTKVFEKADYANKINEAKKLRSKIKSLSKNKDKNANLRDLASKFGKIDPFIVADIDAYNELATQIKNATDGSKIRGQKVNFAETVNIANATDYVNQEIKSQNKILKDERLAELKEIYGVDGFDFTDEEIKALLESDEDISNKDGEIVMATIKKAFNIYSTLIQNSIKNGVDAFTGEDVSFTKKEKETIAKFMSMDLSKIGNKNALQAVDALANFIENKSTAKMAATVATYVGDTNAEIIVKKGIYAMPLRKIFSPQFGAFLAEQTTALPMVFEKMFKGFNRGGTVMDAMGLTKLINRKSFAERQANNIVADYVKEFYNKNSRPNGQAFNTAYNNTERGMAAFMLRSVIGTEQEMEAEFNRRKGLIEQSIKALSEGNNQQQKKAELYQKVYDKVVVNAKNLQDIKDNTDSKNLEAVDYWHKQWESKFDQLSDVASGIYNKVLGKDLNYSSPDKYSKMKASKDVDLINNNESAFIGNTNGILYNKKTGVLMDVTNSSNLPTSNKKVTSYIDLSFDKNNSNSMYDALVDIETAEPIRQVQAFLNSDNYSKIIPDADNAEMLAKRIDTYVQNIRKKNPFSNDEFSKTINKLNKIATLGVGQALGGVTQPLKQVIPVALNTLINGQGLSIGASFDADFVSWLNGTGYAIANRGVQSQADIESLNALLEEAVNSKGQALLNKIQEANSFMLKWFLQKPDVFIAKASWKTYYEKSLKKQDIDPSDVDYKNHDVNEEAANYAQRMVDRQQNISDYDLAGNLFTDKTSKAQVLSKIFMPFAGFRMNQASRLASDLSVLGHWSVSTVEDKKIALLSLSSFATEMAAFKVISAGIGISMGYAAAAFMGKGEDEDEEEKRINNIIKGQATSAITDVVSPLPVFDKLLQTGAAAVFDGVQEGLDITEQDKLSLYSAKPQDYLKNLGLYGMAPDRIIEFGKLVTLATTGEYTDDFGKQKTISEEDMSALTTLIGPALLTNVGLAPSEVAGVVRNSIKLAKKKGETFEEKQEKQAKIDMFQEQLDKAFTPEDIDIATEALNRVKNPKLYEAEKETIKNMKESLLTNEETGITYDNISDVKKYDRPLWEKNFGPDSEWYQVTKGEREVKKLIKQKETEAEEEKFNYVKPKRKSKNSDGTYKKSSSSRSRVKGFGGSSSSSSSSTTERYDSRGVKITTKKSRSRVKGFN